MVVNGSAPSSSSSPAKARASLDVVSKRTSSSTGASSSSAAASAAQTDNKQQGTLRAGFHLVSRVTNQKPLRHVVFNSSKSMFTSTDEKGMRGWRNESSRATGHACTAATGSTTGVGVGNDDFSSAHEPFFPNAPKTTCFYSAVTFVRELSVYFVAALDGTLRVYDDRMGEVSRFKWEPYQGAVLKMVYNPVLDELITAGKHGIMFWRCRYNAKAASAWMADNHGGSASSSANEGAGGGVHHHAHGASSHERSVKAKDVNMKKAEEVRSSASRAKTSQSVFDGRRVPWRGGEFSDLELRHRIDQAACSKQAVLHQHHTGRGSFRRPPPSRGRESTPLHSTCNNTDDVSSASARFESSWFSHIALDVRMQVLAVASGKSVYFFETDTGSLLSRQPNIHTSPIRDLIFISHNTSEHHPSTSSSCAQAAESSTSLSQAFGFEDVGVPREASSNEMSSGNRMMVTCCGDGVVKIWRTREHGRGPLHLLHFLSSFTSPVVSFCTLNCGKTLLIGTDDGFIYLIDLETLEHIHRMRLPKKCKIRKVDAMHESSFYVQTVFDVFTFQLVHLHHTFAQFNSKVERLDCVGGAVTLCAFEDSAIRLISNKQKTTLPLSTTVPAMSRFSLRSHWYNCATRSLYVIMSNGAVHVYDTGTNPSSEVEVWNALAKNRPLCAAHVALKPPEPQTPMSVSMLARVDGGGGEARTHSRYELAAPQVVDFSQYNQHQQRYRQRTVSGETMEPLWPGLYRKARNSRHGDPAAIPGTMAVKNTQSDDPDVDMLAIGTEDGDVLFVDTANHGCVRRSFPAHRNRPISRICYNYARRVLVTAALRTIRIWGIAGLELLLQLTYEDAITCMDQLKGMLIIGLRNGSIRTVDLSTLQQDTLPIEGGHSAIVRDVAVSESLDQFVTCCSQGLLKVFTLARDGKAEFSLRLEQSISCICYQDNKGNLLAGLGNKIVRVRAKVLAQAPNELTEAVKAEYNSFTLGGMASVPAGDDEDVAVDGETALPKDAEARACQPVQGNGEPGDACGGGTNGDMQKETEARTNDGDQCDITEASGDVNGVVGDGDGENADTTDGEGGAHYGAFSSADEDEDAEDADRRRLLLLMMEAEDIADDVPSSIASTEKVQAPVGAATTGKKKRKKKRRQKGSSAFATATGGRFRSTRMDPAVQIGLLELKVSEQNTKRMMQKCGIDYSHL